MPNASSECVPPTICLKGMEELLIFGTLPGFNTLTNLRQHGSHLLGGEQRGVYGAEVGMGVTERQGRGGVCVRQGARTCKAEHHLSG